VECIGRAKTNQYKYTCQEKELETPEVEGHDRRIQEEIKRIDMKLQNHSLELRQR